MPGPSSHVSAAHGASHPSQPTSSSALNHILHAHPLSPSPAPAAALPPTSSSNSNSTSRRRKRTLSMDAPSSPDSPSSSSSSSAAASAPLLAASSSPPQSPSSPSIVNGSSRAFATRIATAAATAAQSYEAGRARKMQACGYDVDDDESSADDGEDAASDARRQMSASEWRHIEQRRELAQHILHNPEMLLTYAESRHDSIPGTRVFFTLIAAGYTLDVKF